MIKQISALTLVLSLVLLMGYAVYEPSNVSAQATDNDSVVVTLSVDEEIAITSPADVDMAPNIGVNSDTSVGEATWNVTTNAAGGYTLGIKASTSPALQSGGESFADYTEAVAGTPETWTVANGAYEFGFSAFGDDVEAEHSGTETACEAANALGTTDLAYEGFTTSDEVIATSGSETSTSGTDSTVCFAAEQNGIFAPPGTYTATITATATTQ